MEEAMAKQNLLPKNVPRAELDQRAREARIRIERLERLLVPCVGALNFWRRPLVRFATFRFNGNVQRNGQTGSALIDRQQACTLEHESVSADRIGSDARFSDTTKSPAVAAGQRGSAGDGYADFHHRACLREGRPAAAGFNRAAMSGSGPTPL